MANRDGAAARAAIGIFGIVLVLVIGLLGTIVGWLTCHEDDQSSDQAPHLCGSVGSGVAVWLPTIIGAIAVLGLMVTPLRTRRLVLAIATVVAAEGAVVVMWALVSHGTISY